MLLDSILTAISPTLLIPKPEWQRIWRQSEFGLFKRTGRILCLGFFLLYFSHYFLIDVPVKKTPIEWWAYYRFSVSGVALLAFLLSYTKWYSSSKFYKIPALVCTVYTVYMQGESMGMRADIPFFYVPLFAMFGAYALRLSILGTLAAFSSAILAARLSFYYHPEQTHHMVSASLVAAIVLVVLRSRLKKDLETFILQQQHQEAQKQLIESQLATMEQLRSFLPRVLFRRVNSLIQDQRKTPLQAVAEVTKPRKTLAAVLYSDIRGFTALSKSGEHAILSSILPAQRNCTDTIENFGGIPRLQGDLVFAYFDETDAIVSVTNAVRAAIQLYEVTNTINRTTAAAGAQIKRFAILSFGEAIVGNIGGTEGAMDITVIGGIANLPSRLDSLTKEASLKKYMERSPVILTTEALGFLSALFPSLGAEQVDLASFGLSVRDFPEETKIHLLWPTEKNVAALQQQPNVESGSQYLIEKYPTGPIEKVSQVTDTKEAA